MKRQTYRLIEETIQLTAIMLSVIALTMLFTAISRALDPEKRESLRDERQIGSMQDYQQTQNRVNFIYY